MVINSNEESILMLLDLYLCNFNERDYNIVLDKYYCDDFDPSSITTIIITSCSQEMQSHFLDINSDLLIMSVINKNSDVCDNRMYILLLLLCE